MDFRKIFDSFSNKTILVVGDVMIDSYIIGKVSRISPEAPVPIVNFTSKENRLGGAANVALNLKSLGAKVIMATIVGNDVAGKEMIDLFHENEIEFDSKLLSETRKSTVKTRVLGNKQQLLRIDDEQINDLTQEEEDRLLHHVHQLLETQSINAIVFEDYNKGVLTERTIQEIITLSKKYKVITTVDPKKENFFSYQGVTFFKPNLKELMEGVEQHISFKNDLKDLRSAVEKLQLRLDNEITMITLSENGVYIKSNTHEAHFSAHLRDIADVSGAGDTVISVATLCLTAGCLIEEVAFVSNIAGGLVCEETGVVPINKEKLLKEVMRLY